MTQITIYTGKDSSRLICLTCKRERGFFTKGPCVGCEKLANCFVHKPIHVFEVIAGGWCVKRKGL